MQRRIEQPDRDGQARHRLEDPAEVRFLKREQLRERCGARFRCVTDDHTLHDRQAIGLHEHVLGAA